MEVSLHTCSLGEVLIGTYGERLYSVELGTTASECYHRFINRWHKGLDFMGKIESPNNLKIVSQVIESIDTCTVHPDLKISLNGTLFQRQVWEALRTVNLGDTISYKEIARKINNENAVRAIGTACGANPIAVIVPCHRAGRTDGSDSGYRWGIDIKKKLLDREHYLKHPKVLET